MQSKTLLMGFALLIGAGVTAGYAQRQQLRQAASPLKVMPLKGGV